MMLQSITREARLKGDEGIYAAIDAARLAQALRGATLSRLTARDVMGIASVLSAHPAIFASPQDAAANSGSPAGHGPALGVSPRQLLATNASESVRVRVRQEALADHDLEHEFQVAIGMPDTVSSPAFRALAPYLRKVQPAMALTYEKLQELLLMISLAAEMRSAGKGGMTTLDLTGCVVPSCVAAAGKEQDEAGVGSESGSGAAARISPEALEKLVKQLQERYPLPVPTGKKANGGDMSGSDDAEEEEEEEDREALRHNAELRGRCERLQLPYTNYRAALRSVALYEAEVFPLVCQFLSTDNTVKVVLMGHNRLGAESRRTEGSVDLRALRALAAMIDANQSIKVLDVSHNELGPNGIGIVCKALTKNICLAEVDLSENGLGGEALEELEDPEFEEEDPVFGERYAGLEAISEVLKKNKFLRVLRVGGNGIHAGDDLSAPAEEDDGGVEEGEDADTTAAAVPVPTPDDVVAGWEEVPLWKLVQPLRSFHRLTVLDLRGNQLGVLGARMLATALSTNHSLRALDLTDNGIGYRGLHYLASLVLASPTSVLDTLVLQRNSLSGKSRKPATQKKLRLKPKKAALAAMHAFAAAMHGNRRVRRLVLSENHLGPILSAAMLSTISRAEALEELDFSWNEACGDHESLLDLTAVQSLAAALYPSTASSLPPHRPTLARLYLSGNNLCAAGLAALFPNGGLAPEYALEELDLSRNYVGDALGPLSHLLQVSPTVTRLNLSYNNITSLSGMLDGLRVNTSLAYLDVSHNKLGSQEEQRHLPADFGGAATMGTLVGGSLKNPAASQTEAVAAATMDRHDPATCAAQREEVVQLWHCLAGHRSLAAVNLSWNDLREEHATDFLAALSSPDVATSAGGSGGSNGDNIRDASCLAHVDISSNPKIPVVLVQALLAALAARQGMRTVYTSVPRTVVQQQQQQQATAEAAAVLETMASAVANSTSLQDVSCWGADFGEQARDTVEAVRQRLLLNALLAAAASE